MPNYAPFAEEDDLPNDLFRLQRWTALELDTVVTGPLVVLTALSTEPLVLFPKYRHIASSLTECFLLTFEDWETTGYTNWGIVTNFPKIKYLSLAGAKKLVAAGSWYTSGNPAVAAAVYTHEAARGIIPRLATIERRMALGWDGFGQDGGTATKVQLSWWKMYLAQRKRLTRAWKRQVLWALISGLTTFAKRKVSPPEGRSFLLWTETPRTKLSDLYPDTAF
jgi:hypothetical protein